MILRKTGPLERSVALLWPLSLALPCAAWLQQTGNPLYYWLHPMPAGQWCFVAAKLIGLLTLVLLWWQAMLGLLPALASRVLGGSRPLVHRWHGLAVLLMMLAHGACFIVAASLRSHHVASQYLALNWEDYYSSRVSLGALAVLILLASAVQPLLLWRRVRLWLPALHGLGVTAFYLGIWHALSIGSETRFVPLQAQFLLMLALLTLTLSGRVLRWASGWTRAMQAT